MSVVKGKVKIPYTFALDVETSNRIDAMADIFGSSRSYVVGLCINVLYRMVGADKDEKNLTKLLDIKLNPEEAEKILRNATAK